MPVGHIGKFDLEEREIHGFRMNLYFSKIRMEPVMFSFLATTENKAGTIATTEKIKDQNDRIDNSGKVTEKQREIATSNFQDNNKNHESRAVPS